MQRYLTDWMSSTSASEDRPGATDVPPASLPRSTQWIDPELEAQSSLERLPSLNPNERSLLFCCFTNEKVFRILLVTYWVWTLVSFVNNIDVVFPAMFLFPICSMLSALVGSSTDTYQLLIPFMLMTVFDMFYSSLDLFCIINVHFENSKETTIKFITEKWPTKMDSINRMNKENFEANLLFIIFRISYASFAALTTGQEITRYRIQGYIEQRRNEIHRRRMWRSDRNARAFVNEAFNMSSAPIGVENTTSMLFSSSPTTFFTTTNIPPPPPYQTLPSLRTPTSGTPPPTYSTIERQQPTQLTNPEVLPTPLPVRLDESGSSSNSNLSSPVEKSTHDSPV